MSDGENQMEVGAGNSGDEVEEAPDDNQVVTEERRRSSVKKSDSSDQQLIVNFDQSLPSAHSVCELSVTDYCVVLLVSLSL